MRISSWRLIVGLAILCPVAASRADSPVSEKAPLSVKPAASVVSWLKDADIAGNAEVAAAELAIAKAQRADVKAFAQKMADEHGQANRELGALATKKGVALPAKKPSDHGLDNKTGADFDAAYVKLQVSDHEKVEKLFEKGAQSDDADLRAFAEKTLPAIREHLAEARRLAATPPPASR